MSPRYGSVPLHGSGDGGAIEGIQYEGKKPKPAPQQTANQNQKNSSATANNAMAANVQPNGNSRYYNGPRNNTKYYGAMPANGAMQTSGPPTTNGSAKNYSNTQFDDGTKLPPGAKVVSDTITE